MAEDYSLVERIARTYAGYAEGGHESLLWLENMGATEEDLELLAEHLRPAFAAIVDGKFGLLNGLTAILLSGVRVGYILGTEDGIAAAKEGGDAGQG